jgi:hypothetical protein
MPATYEPIATQTLGSAATSISFTSIPATYTDLRLVLYGVPLNTSGTFASVRLNSDTGTNYSYTYLEGNGAAITTARQASVATCYINPNYASGIAPYIGAVDVFSYAGSTFKTMLFNYSGDKNAANGGLYEAVALWRNTAAVTGVDFVAGGNQFQSGTIATIYGIKAA